MKRLLAFVILSFAIRHSANAAVIYSGLQNLAIPTNLTGIYINVVIITQWSVDDGIRLGWQVSFLHQLRPVRL
jgi:hypothetical protein